MTTPEQEQLEIQRLMDQVLYTGYQFVKVLSNTWLVTAPKKQPEQIDEEPTKDLIEISKIINGQKDNIPEDLDLTDLIDKARALVNSCSVTPKIYEYVLSDKLVSDVLDCALIVLASASAINTLGVKATIRKGTIIYTGSYRTGGLTDCAIVACKALVYLLEDKDGRYSEITLQFMYNLYERTTINLNEEVN